MEVKTKYIVADIMTRDLISVSHETSAKETARVMDENAISSLLIEKGGSIVGIVTDKDFAESASKYRDLSKIPIRKFMTKDLIYVDAKTSLTEAAQVINENNIRHLLVKTSEKYVGILSVKDILSTLYHEIKEQNRLLKSKIEELERFYKVAIDRELVMVRLKKKIHELEKKLGEESNLAELLVE